MLKRFLRLVTDFFGRMDYSQVVEVEVKRQRQRKRRQLCVRPWHLDMEKEAERKRRAKRQ